MHILEVVPQMYTNTLQNHKNSWYRVINVV